MTQSIPIIIIFIMQKHSKSAFSLLELSIIAMLISILFMGYMAWTTNSVIDDGYRLITTQQKMARIHSAILNFYAFNQRIPCPANRTVANETTYSYGGITRLYDDEYGQFSVTGTWQCGSAVGSVPTRALNLPSDYMVDGWNRRFNYHTSPNICDTTACTSVSFATTASLIVKPSSAGTTLVNDAAYVLVSYGADGYGSYLPSGSTKGAPPAGNADEIENSNGDTIYVQKSILAGYTNLTEFRTIPQITKANPPTASSSSSSSSLITSSQCAANSAALAALDSSQATILANTITATRRCTTINTANCATTYDMAGDAAVMDIMLVLQDVCYELYGAPTSVARSCTTPWNSFTTANACCPTKYGAWKGKAVNCTVAYQTDVNACIVTNYDSSKDCWYVAP
jgi:hypothetical protein